MGIGVPGLEPADFAVRGNRPIELALLLESHAEVVVKNAQICLQVNGLAKLSRRRYVISLDLIENAAKRVVGQGVVGLDGDGLVVLGDRLVELPLRTEGLA